MKKYYPMMVDINGLRCLVVGGGKVAERKTRGLLDAGALVTVVSPKLTPQLAQWADTGEIEWRRRLYRREDHEGCRLVIAATDQAEVNVQIRHEADARGQWVNVIDHPELCTFTVPATVTRGKLCIAVSTGGASPSLAQTIRDQLASMYGEEYELHLELLQEMRGIIQQRVPVPKERYRLMKELAGEEWLEECRANPEKVRNKMYQWLDHALSPQT
ncbi:precorrin-2 dehydrogenase/sirohydrochlorin ferrochelatase family protein [Laceyella sacchari]|uniref:precorrin-2 dehydrogenase n=1 Tax=Laceyella sacchari TaxID=37482 RepID=A0ABY5U9B7_LACSH|nr:bifunctional precorrin-2 dehydrogenase/sirohydrochlorin ferrochelatase [Laceyella sacchari]TCW41059.1 precorrin-2 dehydrogenase [Laceyella sacchari]UWE04653.1 bifunctional precorrin-2 dehydrogenase/sirohydrochlorin ferrochelatase [Laceyella sacchari]